MTVEADHPVGRRHDHMQIMADHQHCRAGVLSHGLNQAVEGRLAGLVKALGRLIKDEELRGGEKGARQKHALELTAGEGGHLALCHTLNPDAGQNFRGGGIVDPHRERQEAPDRYGHRPIHRELLRHIAKPQAGSASDGPMRQWDNAQKRADQRGFARAVRAKNGDDLSGADGEGHVMQDLGPAKADADAVGRNQGWGDQGCGHAVPAQAGQSPSASILARSMTKPDCVAAFVSAAITGAAGASATVSQTRQIRKAGA